jgi:hypothetical protein
LQKRLEPQLGQARGVIKSTQQTKIGTSGERLKNEGYGKKGRLIGHYGHFM